MAFTKNAFTHSRKKRLTDLPPLHSSAGTANRLDFARWFFDDKNPLTARVAVNRYWQRLFGRGLSANLEDFGGAGEAPSHPQLLDWLALYFKDSSNW